MATSQNGFTAIDSGSDARLKALPWVTGKVLAGPVFTVLDHLARRFNAEVEPIRRDHSWGYAARNIRGAEVTSNHASGTAVDFNAPSHPLGASGTFSPGKRTALLQILRDLDGVVRWGGTYSGRKDEMHFEINASPAKVTALAQRLAGSPASPGTQPARPTINLPEEDMPTAAEIAAALLNTPHPEWGNRTMAQQLAQIRNDIAAVHNATGVLLRDLPGLTATATLTKPIAREGVGTGNSSVATNVARTDDQFITTLNAIKAAALDRPAVIASLNDVLADVKLTATEGN